MTNGVSFERFDPYHSLGTNFFGTTRIMINKGMVNKGKYWIFERNKDVSVSNFGEPKGRNKGIQYWISF